MSKKVSFKTTILLILVFVLTSSITYGQTLDMGYKEYEVLKGDTLWDISSKEFEESDPFLWPKIWKDNIFIKNPDLIYPGQKIKIPLRLLKKEQPAEAVKEEAPKEEAKTEQATTEKASAVPATPEIIEAKKIELEEIEFERKITPITKGYMADIDLILSSGYITDYITKEIKSVGQISDSPSGRTVWGTNDYVYIKTKVPANAGDKFYIIRSVSTVKHPKTNNKLGKLVAVIGIVEVIGIEDGKTKAIITKSYSDANTNDLLDTYYDVEPIFEEDSPRKPDISGVIVATKQMRIVNGTYDVIFIDKGSNNGLELGDAFKTISVDKDTKARTTGIAQIISVKETTAAALIKQSESTLGIGDEIASLNQ